MHNAYPHFLFRSPTDPKEAPRGSIRRTILEKYNKLGLKSQPNQADNGVHASASPFEGLAEKVNWLNMNLNDDAFGLALVKAGISKKTIESWCLDPQIRISEDATGSVFDALEEMDADACLEKMVEFNILN
jgi:hypothetical protein